MKKTHSIFKWLLAATVIFCLSAIFLTACNDGNTSSQNSSCVLTVDGGYINGDENTSVKSFTKGSSVTISANAEVGKRFIRWTDAGGRELSKNNPYTFSINNNLTLKAVFETVDDVFTVSVSGGYIGSDTDCTSYEFAYGASVSVRAQIPDGKDFVRWTDGDGVEISAENPYTFNVFSDTALYAVFKFEPVEPEYAAVSVEGGYIGEDEECSYLQAEIGAHITIHAITPTGKRFEGWEVDGVPVSSQVSYTFVVSSNVTVSAVFVNRYTLSVNGGNIAGGADSGVFDEGETVNVVATPKNGYDFKGWFIDDESEAVSFSYEYSFTLRADTQIKAVFEKQKKIYTLEVLGGGCVAEIPDGGDKPLSTGKTSVSYEEGTRVYVLFSVPANKVFDGWRKGGETVSSDNPYSFVLSENTVLTATHSDKIVVAPTTYRLNVIGGSFNGLISAVLEEGSEVTVTPNADTATERFTGWKINGEIVSISKDYTFEINDDVTIEAVFEQKFRLSVFNGNAPNPEISYREYDEEVTVSAQNVEGSKFICWVVEGNEPVSGTDNWRESFSIDYTLTVQHDCTLRAVYAKNPAEGKLSLTVVGGAAYSDAACGSIKGDGVNVEIVPTDSYNDRTVYLLAEEREGWSFGGWYSYYEKQDSWGHKGANIYQTNVTLNSTHTGNVVMFAVYVQNYTVSVSNASIEGHPTAVKSNVRKYDKVTVTAAEFENKVFSRWLINGVAVPDSVKVQTFTVTQDTFIEAEYNNLYTVTVDGGFISGTTDREAAVQQGLFVNITAEFADSAYKKFKGWKVGNAYVGLNRELKYRVDSPVRITAVYDSYYSISVQGGTVNGAASGVFKNDTQLTLVADSLNGKRFKEWNINGVLLANSKATQVITASSDMVIKAVFDTVYTVTVADEYSLVDGGRVPVEVVAGTEVTLSAQVRSGYFLIGWQIGGTTVYAEEDTYLIKYKVNANVSVKTLYVEKCELKVIGGEGGGVYRKGDTVTVTAHAASANSAFVKWVNAMNNTMSTSERYTFRILTDTTLTAVYENLYSVTLSGGVFVGGEFDGLSSGVFLKGSSVKIKAVVPEKFRFDCWVNDSTQQNFGNDTLTFTVSAEVSYTARFVRQYSVTIVNTGEVKIYDAGSRVIVEINAPLKQRFVKWIETGSGKGYTDNPFIIESVDKDWVLSAEFINEYTVTVQNIDGRGTYETSAVYVEGDSVSVRITDTLPSPKMAFMNWSLNGENVSNASSYTFTATQDTTIEAVFSRLYTQSSIIGIDQSKSNCKEYSEYFSRGSTGFIIPGLRAGENFITQGIDYWEEQKWYFVGGYIKPANNYSTNSVIYAIDMNRYSTDPLSGKSYRGVVVKEIILEYADGKAYTGHVGGLAVTEKNLVIADSKGDDHNLQFISLDTVLSSKYTAYLRFEETVSVPVNSSYCTYTDGILWVGEFIISGDSDYPIKYHDNDGYAWTVGYTLNEKGAVGYDSATGIKYSSLSFENATPDYILRVTDKVQGMTVAGNKIVLSMSYGRTKKSTVSIYNNTVYGKNRQSAEGNKTINGTGVPFWTLSNAVSSFSAAPMTEDIALYLDTSTSTSTKPGDYYVMVATESASNLYKNGTDNKGIALNPMDITWLYKIEQ